MIKKAFIAAAVLLAFSAHAGYAQLASPSGYASTAGGHTYAASAANDKVFGKVIHQPNGLSANVGGQSVKMPAAYRLAANAPRIAAAAIYLNPYVRTGVAIAAWLGVGKFVWDEAEKQWKKTTDTEQIVEAFEYSKSGTGRWFPSANAACADWVSSINGNGGFYTSGGSASGLTCKYSISVDRENWFPDSTTLDKRAVPCPAGWTPTPAGCLLKTSEVKTVTQPEFEEALSSKPMPERVPLELPPNTPLPVEQPYINPAPGENPSNNPLRVPTGTPVPIPNTDPQQYRQPYVDIVPAPTPDSPWRVDVKPGETTSTNPNPVENPQPDSQDKPAEEEDKSLCEKHPEIAACEKVEVTDKPLPNQPKLYEPKYPDGITGLWNSKLQEIKATPLFNLAPSLLPNVSAGSCPSWKVDLSIDGWTNAGLQDVSPPCWVWDVAKLVIIASALLLARRLIFGG